MVQDELKLIGQYRAGFTGEVPKSFSQPTPFKIEPCFGNENKVAAAYGLKAPEGHPTPTDPHYKG